MSNEELAAIIQAGNREQTLDLWEQVRRFAYQQSNRWYLARGIQAGMTIDDFMQTAFLALLDTLAGWRAGAGSFLTWYDMRLKAAFTVATGQRTRRDIHDPMQTAASLNAPLRSSEDGQLLLGDTVTDQQAEAAFQTVEEQELRTALNEALGMLPADQLKVVVLRYYQGFTTNQAAQRLNVTIPQARKLEQKAMRALRHPAIIRKLRAYS